jgi:predicted N-acyltransferase
LPIPWKPARYAIQSLLRRRPLFICRSPLANASGLILPEPPLRQPALEIIINVAMEEAKKHNASFLIFDYLEEEQTHWSDWSKQFTPLAVSDPGTRMEIHWSSFDQYLAHLTPKNRKHYRQHLREAERREIKIDQHDCATDIDAAPALIQRIESRHRASANPWTKRMLENANLVDATWLAARMNDRLVGCELILEDNGTQLVTALGLAENVSPTYFLLGYEDIRGAIEKGVRILRWGSGAYEVKQRLGFQIEQNNHAVFQGIGKVARLACRLAAKWLG